jgi:hypothetical protein
VGNAQLRGGNEIEGMHEVNLLDIEIDLADVLPIDDSVRHLSNA